SGEIDSRSERYGKLLPAMARSRWVLPDPEGPYRYSRHSESEGSAILSANRSAAAFPSQGTKLSKLKVGTTGKLKNCCMARTDSPGRIQRRCDRNAGMRHVWQLCRA